MSELYELEPTEGHLEEGIVGIYIEELDLDLKNILLPYCWWAKIQLCRTNFRNYERSNSFASI